MATPTGAQAEPVEYACGGMGVFFVVGFFIAVLGFGAQGLARQRRRAEDVRNAFRLLGAEAEGGWSTFDGHLRGVHVTYELVGTGRSNNQPTVCTARLPGVPQLELDLRPETRSEKAQVAHGRAIDVQVGDKAFDEAFVVEAAPSELARALLDAPTRAVLLAFAPCRLELIDRDLTFTKSGYVEQTLHVRQILETVVGLSTRMFELPAQVAEQRLLAAATNAPGYRGMSLGASIALEKATQDQAELAALASIRERRWDLHRTTVEMIAIFAIGGIALWMFLR
jgi:hypothetical protein